MVEKRGKPATHSWRAPPCPPRWAWPTSSAARAAALRGAGCGGGGAEGRHCRREVSSSLTSLSSKVQPLLLFPEGEREQVWSGGRRPPALWEAILPRLLRNPDAFPREALMRGASRKRGRRVRFFRIQNHRECRSVLPASAPGGWGKNDCVSAGALAVQSPAPGYILQSFSGKFSVMRWSG